MLEKKGDDSLLNSIKKYLEKRGFSFFNWTKYCPELFSTEKYLTHIKPSKNALNNLSKANSVYQQFRKIDVGQSIVIQNQLVLGLEAIEGTDKLIERCNLYKRKGDKGIILKFSKNQRNAEIFLEFLISPKVQKHIVNNTFEYPIIDEISPSPFISQFGISFVQDQTPASDFGKFNSDSIKLMDRAGWK